MECLPAALIAFAFASGGRRSEVAAATMEALKRHPDDSFTYVLGRSKTNQLAKRRAIDHNRSRARRLTISISGWRCPASKGAGGEPLGSSSPACGKTR